MIDHRVPSRPIKESDWHTRNWEKNFPPSRDFKLLDAKSCSNWTPAIHMKYANRVTSKVTRANQHGDASIRWRSKWRKKGYGSYIIVMREPSSMTSSAMDITGRCHACIKNICFLLRGCQLTRPIRKASPFKTRFDVIVPKFTRATRRCVYRCNWLPRITYKIHICTNI